MKIKSSLLSKSAIGLYGSDSEFIEEIVVTGLKREESLQEVSISINEKSVPFLKLF